MRPTTNTTSAHQTTKRLLRVVVLVLAVVVFAVMIQVLRSVFQSMEAEASGYQPPVAGVSTSRFHGYIDVDYPNRIRVGGDPGLAFIDRYKAHTHYTVCYRGPERRCSSRTTGRAGQKSVVFMSAPFVNGNFTVVWSVGGRTVATERFHNGLGD